MSACMWTIFRRFPFDVSLAFSILGGILISPHTTFLDGILAIPALLFALHAYPQARWLALALLSPVVSTMYIIGPGTIGPAIFVGGCVIVIAIVLRSAVPLVKPEPSTDQALSFN